MAMADTLERLGVILRSAIGSKKDLRIYPTARLQDIVTSSLQFIVVLSEIERAFDITIPEAYLDPAKWGDLGSIAHLIDELSKTAA